jgi:hypothetical protein
MEQLILEIQDRIAFYAKHAASNRDAIKAIDSLKQLRDMVQSVEALEQQIKVLEAANG